MIKALKKLSTYHYTPIPIINQENNLMK